MEYKHFSHAHTLTVHRVGPGQRLECHGCGRPCTDGSTFACWPCKFFLHDHCGNANRYVKHPSHGAHPLILLPSPTYCSGSFLCNACGLPGTTFSYTCALCEIDLHLHCAYLPPTLTNATHPHQIRLTFRGPTPENKAAANCVLCTREVGAGHWSYLCEKGDCGFRAHTYCATSEVRPGLYRDEEPETGDSGDALAEMFRVQMQLQMAQQVSHMLGSIVG